MTGRFAPRRRGRTSPAAVRAIAAPAAMFQAADRNKPTTPLAAPMPAAVAIIGPMRSTHWRAASAGTVRSATASSVPDGRHCGHERHRDHDEHQQIEGLRRVAERAEAGLIERAVHEFLVHRGENAEDQDADDHGGRRCPPGETVRI